MTLEVHALVQYAQDFHVTLSATPEEDHVPGVRIAPQPVPDIRPCPACDFASPQSFEDRGQATKIGPPRIYRRVVCSTTKRPYRVSSGLHRTPPLLLRVGCIRWGREGGGCYTNRPI